MTSAFVFTSHGDPHHQIAKKPPDSTKQPPPKTSFRDKLLGPSQTNHTREKEDMIEKKLVRIELEDGNRLLPKVYLEPKVFQDLCTPWKDAIVIKLLGKNLAVSHWSPEFASPNATVERTVVWVRFPGLNLVYYDESFLLAMASAIGRPIKVDINTLNVERGKFARVCVEVDLTVLVVGKIWVNGHWYKVQYEGLHLICTNCGCYGHLGRKCPLSNTVPEVAANQHRESQTVNNSRSTHQHSNRNQQELNVISQNGIELNAGAEEKETEKEQITNNKDESSKLHGDWLLVTRRKKKSHQLTTENSKSVTHTTNNFNVLSPLAHQKKSKAINQKLPPRPKESEIARPNKRNTDPKRRRHDDQDHVPIIFPSNHEPIIKSDPTSHKSLSHDLHKSLPSPHAKKNVTPPPILTHVTVPNDHNTPDLEKNHNFDPSYILQPVPHTNNDQQDVHLAHAKPNDDNGDDKFENCEAPKHNEEDMVT
ncbi:uncharacterized protein LOC123904449 [Trifolium pratense]|uniref:uncharacterized protein LOC123904449 n=1 Tax=Trifolium pratense TaxID=57577 RepID=UPI001E69094B|nr:uncharacterized protein LOC123904449 [Trifolium pratense]